MKIKVLSTGGTISCAPQNGFLSPTAEAKYELIAHYSAHHPTKVEWMVSQPYQILSEQLSATHLNCLIKEVKASLQGDFDGIIVTHGTDTLPFTAAVLDFAFASAEIPIVLVSAFAPLSDPCTNGYSNFEAAVQFIEERRGCGVFCAYANREEPVHFHRGSLVLQYREADDCLFSLKNQIYAIISDGEITLQENSHKTTDCLGDFTLVDYPHIQILQACPGESYELPSPSCKAVMLRPYHSGTLNTDCTRFRRFCQNAAERELPLFVVGAVEGLSYESTRAYKELNLLPLYRTTFAASYMRLWIGISRGENLRELFS